MQNNKSKSKTVTVSCDQSAPQQTNNSCNNSLQYAYVPTVSQAIEEKHSMHVWLNVYVVGSHDWLKH